MRKSKTTRATEGSARATGRNIAVSRSALATTSTQPVRRGPKPVLVCGGAGFIGSHLCERLVRRGTDVICLDNFSTSTEAGIAHLLGEPNFELRQLDVAAVQAADIEDIDAIYNLACMASPIHYQRSPLDTLFTSVNGVDTLLRVARRCGARIFQASTSEIYGHPDVHPQTESYWGYVNTMGPRACYDEGKRCAETLCFIYQTEYEVPVRVGRIFNTYGPRMNVDDGRVVVNFIVQALRNQPLTVYGDGSQTRSFCYIDDLLDAIELLMHESNGFAGPVNLGNPVEIPVSELARRVIRLTSSRSRIAHEPLPVDDPPRRRPDISLAQEMLSWQPRIDLDSGLTATIAYFEELLRTGEDPLAATHRESRNEKATRAPHVQIV